MRIFLCCFFTALLFPLALRAECIEGDCNNGHGTRVYSSGSKYSGDWQNDLPHGHGTKNYPNGNRYEGEWLKGKRNGNGITTRADGRVFKETWRKGVVLTQVAVSPVKDSAVAINGPDEAIFQTKTEAEQITDASLVQTPLSPDPVSKQKVRSGETDAQDSSSMSEPEPIQFATALPSSTELTMEPPSTMEKNKAGIGKQSKSPGKLTDDKPAAHRQEMQIQSPAPEVTPQSAAQVVEEGTIIDPAGSVYVGQLLDHLPHGQGTLTFVDGAVYKGEFRHDSREGRGVLTLANGEKYVGQFLNNEAHGQGEYFFPDGRKYVGAFEHDLFCGEGVLIFTDGVCYSGRFRENLPHGFGDLIHPDGRQYVGNFASGLFHGKGMYTFAGGKEKAGYWLAGEYSGE
ncbi:MAG: hypothetical protein U9R66_09730 [Thermodesulfobacteriota bacterium]|nr:hypothetical protein [Thermodesulfobacteriota bacterium]